MIKFERLPGDVLQRIDKAKDFLGQDKNIIFAYLFGGLAKGHLKPLSDVDLAVYLKSIEDVSDYKMRLFLTISEILDTSELDIVILNTAPTSISGRIIQGRQILVDKEPFKRHAYESTTLREFFDFKIKESSILRERYKIG